MLIRPKNLVKLLAKQLSQSRWTQNLLGAGDQFRDAQLSGSGAEGEAHELRDVEDRKTIRGLTFFFNLMLASIEVSLAEGIAKGDDVRPCSLIYERISSKSS
jgi:hypothetical protein